MSAARPEGERRPIGEPAPGAVADISSLRARRRTARRRTRLARMDLGLAVATALVLLIATPGLAIAGLIAGVALVVCAASFAVERRRRRRARQAGSELRSSRDQRRSEH
jgi:Flp pilus assembly protein TadB